MTATQIHVTSLAEQCRLSPGVRLALVEAAGVMLFHHDQANPCEGQWAHEASETDIVVVWTEPNDEMIRTHSNLKDATEDGAYAVAIAAVAALGYEVCGRTVQGSGADYWMVRRGGDPADIYHLEVSGISEGGAPGHRLTQKIEQGQSGPIRRPGVAVVFRFKEVDLLSRTW